VSVIELSWLQTGLLLLAPAIVLAVALILGRYPGEELFLESPPKAVRPRRSRAGRPAWIAPVLHVGGSDLIGRRLAGRAPPLLLSCDP
jgi:hypothetical protein